MEVQLRRVVYFEHRPTKFEVDAAVKALRNTRYVCGGRIASFGRSLSVMEELHDVHRPEDKIEDEINNSQARTEDLEKEDESTTAIDNLDDQIKNNTKLKRMIWRRMSSVILTKSNLCARNLNVLRLKVTRR